MGQTIRSLAIVAIWLAVTTASNAEEYTEYVAGSPTNPGSTVTLSPSSISALLSFGGLLNSTTPPLSLLPGSYLNIDQNLDSSNTGTLRFNGGALRAADFARIDSFYTLGTALITFSGITFTINTEPISVTNGDFSITPTTIGSITINSGILRFQSVNYFQNVDQITDFSQQPATFLFSSLTAPLTGYADGNSTGGDNDSSPHDGNLPGLTGVNLLDTDGAEVKLLNLDGIKFQTRMYNQSGQFGSYSWITISGNIAVSVPEVSSIIFIGMTVCGLSVLWLRKS